MALPLSLAYFSPAPHILGPALPPKVLSPHLHGPAHLISIFQPRPHVLGPALHALVAAGAEFVVEKGVEEMNLERGRGSPGTRPQRTWDTPTEATPPPLTLSGTASMTRSPYMFITWGRGEKSPGGAPKIPKMFPKIPPNLPKKITQKFPKH